jgi:hypothetical protein
MNTAPNSPWKGFHPNVTPFGNSPRYDRSAMESLYKRSTDEVVSTLKPIDKEKATLEAEQGEIVAQYKNGGLSFHDVKGTRHSKKGTPLNLEDGAFIYSRFNKMRLTPDEIETFKLGSFVKSKDGNTPAFVLKRNLDIEHNNDLLTKYTDSKNSAEKNTAKLMLQKYQQIAGKIAALQEIRKPNPNIPGFGNLTPSSDMPQAIEKQYAKLGGFVLPKAQEGMYKIKGNLPGSIDYNPIGQTSEEDLWKDENTYENAWKPKVYSAFSDPKRAEELIKNLESYKGQDFEDVQAAINKGKTPEEKKSIAIRLATDKKIGPFHSIMNTVINQTLPAATTPAATTTDATTKEDEYTSPPKEDLEENKYYEELLKRPYDYTSMNVNNINSILQGYLNKKYTPGLALTTPLRVREQQFDAQPSVNNALANYYTAGRLNNQYVRPNNQNMQLAYSEALKNVQGIQSQYDKMNQEQSTNAYNQNAQYANNAVNQNAQAFAQYQDKVNERDQFIDDTKKQASANVLQNIGNAYASATQYNMNKDLMRIMQPWKVNQLSQNDRNSYYKELSKMIKDPAYISGDPYTRASMNRVLADQYSPKNRQQRRFGIEDYINMSNYNVN